MKRLSSTRGLIMSAYFGILVGITTLLPLAATTSKAGIDDVVLQADHALVRALQKGNRMAVDKLLAPDFIWVDSDGVMRAKGEILEVLPKPVIAETDDAQVTERTYGQVGVVRIHIRNEYVLHVWVKRSADWRLLDAHEVTQIAHSNGGPGGPADIVTPCVNPCKIVPFKAQTAAEQACLWAFQAEQTAVENRDADDWASHNADELEVVQSWDTRTISKADRVATTQRQARAGDHANGSAPLVWAHMYDLGDTVVMLAEQTRYGSKPEIVSRVWINRDGRWQIAVRYSSVIKAMPPLSFTTTAPD